MEVYKLTDKELLKGTKIARIEEKQKIYQVLLHLKEIHTRMLYADLNCSSLFEYCVRELQYTPGEAQYRVSAVKLMRESKKIEKRIQTGELPLSNAVLVHNHYSKQEKKPSKEELENTVRSICGKTKLQTKEILENHNAGIIESPQNKKIKKTNTKDECRTLLEELLNLENPKVIKKRLREQLKESKERISRSAVKEPNKRKVNKRTRYIPVSIKAAVRLRAKGKCESPGCKNRKNLEFEHVLPYALGGEHSKENLKLYCRLHNQRSARKMFGTKKMSHYENRISSA